MMTIPAPIRIPDAAPRSLRRLEPPGWGSGASAGTAPVDRAVQVRLQDAGQGKHARQHEHAEEDVEALTHGADVPGGGASPNPRRSRRRTTTASPRDGPERRAAGSGAAGSLHFRFEQRQRAGGPPQG